MGRDKNEETRMRCFMHIKYFDYTVPTKTEVRGDGEMREELITNTIRFRNYCHVTDDLATIAILEKRCLEDPFIVEIALSRMQDGIKMLKNGLAQPQAVAELLDIRKVTRE